MKKQYQINKERAVQKFRAAARASQDVIQLAFPLREAAALVPRGLMHLAVAAFTQVAEQMMRWEVAKVPLQRPRVREVRRREAPLGSYESLQRASLMEDAVWNRIMHGLTTRPYRGTRSALCCWMELASTSNRS